MSPARSSVSLSEEQRLALETFLVEFDRAWRENLLAEKARRLPPATNPLRRLALIELVKIDLEKQWQAGRQVAVEGYLHAHPELGDASTAPPELLLAEYQVRQQFGDTVDLMDFARRFPAQAEAMQQLLQGLAPAGEREFQGTRDTTPNRTSMPQAAPLPGSGELPEQFGRYRILEKLGQGGMGAVYAAFDTQLKRNVALKVQRFGANEGKALARFQVEGEALAQLRHPNVCTVYDLGEVDGRHYLTMEFIEGQSLDKMVRGEALRPEQVVALVRTVALALHQAHGKGVIHRDLKPHNIVMRDGREPVVVDFGLARRDNRAEGGLTKMGDMMGTPAYMPPEQVNGDVEAMGPGCDVYSLGVILYELLTGRLPFTGTKVELLFQIVSKPPARPSEVRPGLDPRLDALCLQALAKPPQDRYGSMEAFAEALGVYLREAGPTSESIHTRPPPLSGTLRPEATPRRRRSGWVWPAVGGGVLMALLLFAGVVFKVKTPNGTVVLEIDQPGAEVFVDGDRINLTVPGEKEPVKIEVVEGKHELRVTKQGFQVFTTRFTIGADRAQQIQVTLKPDPPKPPDPPDPPVAHATVKLEIDQPAAEVYLDGGKQAPPAPEGSKGIPLSAPEGWHTLKVTKKGFQDWNKRLLFKAGDERTILAHLVDCRPLRVGREWTIEGSELTQKTFGRIFTDVGFGDDNWTDYDLTVDFIVTELSPTRSDRSVQFFVRNVHPGGSVTFGVPVGRGPSTFFVHNWVYDPRTEKYQLTVLHDGRKPVPIRRRMWNTALVKVRGRQYEYFLNGERIYAGTQGHHKRGAVALRAAGVIARFRNIIVTDPDGMVLWEGLPQLRSSP